MWLEAAKHDHRWLQVAGGLAYGVFSVSVMGGANCGSLC